MRFVICAVNIERGRSMSSIEMEDRGCENPSGLDPIGGRLTLWAFKGSIAKRFSLEM
jgi:hypothetical protein